MFKVSIPTMRRWARRGELPSRHVGNTVRVDLCRVRGLGAEDIGRLAREAWQRR